MWTAEAPFQDPTSMMNFGLASLIANSNDLLWEVHPAYHRNQAQKSLEDFLCRSSSREGIQAISNGGSVGIARCKVDPMVSLYFS
jgi:hypothetical protein